MIKVSILGATGSVGTQVLSVLKEFRKKFRIISLTANKNFKKLIFLCEKYNSKYGIISNSKFIKNINLKLKTKILIGNKNLEKIYEESDYIFCCISGSYGFKPVLFAIRAGKKIILANKEVLVMGGKWLMNEIIKNKSQIIPIDSEHNAILQCLGSDYNIGTTPKNIKKIYLTASGGALRDIKIDNNKNIKPKDVFNHPNWKMGKKINVDSSTMINKCLEIIEAHFLFDLPINKIDILLHRESIVHGIVQYYDGSLIAHLSYPSMKIPILNSLIWPKRLKSNQIPILDFSKIKNLSFSKIDYEKYPIVNFVKKNLNFNGVDPCVLNAANEIAVSYFIKKRIFFYDITSVVLDVLELIEKIKIKNFEDILYINKLSRIKAKEIIYKKYIK